MGKTAKLLLLSKASHCSQIFVGLRELDALGKIDLSIEDYTKSDSFPSKDKAVLLVKYDNKVYVFDLQDGYWEGMEFYLGICDYYYKRSFSDEKNCQFTDAFREKIKPLGFNMFVTCVNNPYEREKGLLQITKSIFGRSKLSQFTTDTYVQGPRNRDDNELRVIFFTRLYDSKHLKNKEKINEINYINSMRIELLRGLRSQFGDTFLGGLENNKAARKLASDLIVSKKVTDKGNYIRLLHSCDIGIGSMGLHESIGWKTAEYIAASMGIVNEKMMYRVPGNFELEKNYLDFTSAEECFEKVRLLLKNPDMLMQMKSNNQAYYRSYLAPGILVWNALNVDK